MKELKAGQYKDGTIVLKPVNEQEREVFIQVLVETMNICPQYLGLKGLSNKECDLYKCKNCWNIALTPIEEGEENED